MLYADKRGKGGVALILMHFLGGSTREWDEVREELGEGVHTVAIDLPGFGRSAAVPGYAVEQMADAVEYRLGELELGRYVLVGHSMAGKVSAVLARRYADRLDGAASDGTGRHDGAIQAGEKLAGLEGLVLVAPSPPGPEPMTDEKRTQMLESLGENRQGDRERARVYVGRNEERDLTSAQLERTTDEVVKMNRAAWVAWLKHGSREDWGERVGVLDLPVLVVAGEKDGSLGPEVQERVTLPHFRHAELKAVKGCSHLIPLERPRELAGLLREFVARLEKAHDGLVPTEYRALIDSRERVSGPTRDVLEKRMAGPGPQHILSERQMQTLRAVLARVIPQEGEAQIDLAGTVAAQLCGPGDGWRYAVLPPDAEAYRTGLDALAGEGFNTMSEAEQDVTLTLLAAKKKEPQGRWFEDVRGAAVSAYMSHPATMARVGFSGIGVGGAYTKFKGFVEVEIGQRETWEPVSLFDQENEAR